LLLVHWTARRIADDSILGLRLIECGTVEVSPSFYRRSGLLLES